MSVEVEGREPLRLEVAKQELSKSLLLLIDEESRSSLKNCVSTVILVNSSLCTMQRIGVLEDEKLVELLLEPVKVNVQCDSIYLGVVTKLVPWMDGAFVNIGCSRLSLMEIRNRKPFIFPPFHQSIKEGGVNSSLLVDPVVNGIENNSLDVEAVDDESIDDSVEYMQGDFGEHETEDELDVSEALTENMNGSVVGSEVEVDLEKDLDQLNEKKKKKKKKKNARKVKSNWKQVQEGTKIIVQVVKEGLGTKGPTVTAYPNLRSRFWVFSPAITVLGFQGKSLDKNDHACEI